MGANRTEIDLHTPGDMVAYYDGLRIRFGEGAFENKLERYRRLAEGGLKRPGAVEESGKWEKGQNLSGVSKPRDVEVDLRFQDRIIVREKGGKRGWGEKDQIIVGLDIGTTKTRAGGGGIKGRRRGGCHWGRARLSRGLRKGVVINIEDTVASVRKAVEEAKSSPVSSSIPSTWYRRQPHQQHQRDGLVAIKTRE